MLPLLIAISCLFFLFGSLYQSANVMNYFFVCQFFASKNRSRNLFDKDHASLCQLYTTSPTKEYSAWNSLTREARIAHIYVFYTTAISGQEILHLKMRNFATILCVKFYAIFALQFENCTLG